MTTLQDVLQNSFEEFRDQPALGFVNGEMLSYGNVRQMVEQQMFRFAQIGIESGDKIAILGLNGPNWVISY